MKFFQGLLIEKFNSIASNQQFDVFVKNLPEESITTSTRFNKNKHDILIEYDDSVNEQTLFAATPVYIKEETDAKFEAILNDIHNVQSNVGYLEINDETCLKSPTNSNLDGSYISTSSNEDSIKIYNVQTGEIVKPKNDNLSETRYDIKVDSGDNLDVPDKNVTGNLVFAAVSHEDVSDTEQVCDEIFKPIKFDDISELEELQLPKVKELAKIFVNMGPVEEHLVKVSLLITIFLN